MHSNGGSLDGLDDHDSIYVRNKQVLCCALTVMCVSVLAGLFMLLFFYDSTGFIGFYVIAGGSVFSCLIIGFMRVMLQKYGPTLPVSSFGSPVYFAVNPR